MSRKKIIRKKVDPLTGKASNEDNAISISLFQKMRKVDPKTGKSSIAENAISYNTFKQRRKVDPVSGKHSATDNAISIAAFRKRRKDDPVTGKSSTADNALRYGAFIKRESKKRKRYKAQLDHGVNHRSFSLKINKGVGNKSLDTGNSLKTEVNEYKLDF
jgi:hypothetical protein